MSQLAYGSRLPCSVNPYNENYIRLGFIFVFTSALGFLVVSKSGFGLHEVKALLYGDLILTSQGDLNVILAALVPVLIYFLGFMRPTLYTFLDRESAKIMGIRVALWEFILLTYNL